MTKPQVITLPAKCRVNSAAALRQQFQDALNTGNALYVDAGLVESCDTCIAQLLFAVAKESHVTWRMSAALRQQLEELALTPGPFHEEINP
jgi:anti-anti-sigma regulatory factor